MLDIGEASSNSTRTLRTMTNLCCFVIVGTSFHIPSTLLSAPKSRYGWSALVMGVPMLLLFSVAATTGVILKMNDDSLGHSQGRAASTTSPERGMI